MIKSLYFILIAIIIASCSSYRTTPSPPSNNTFNIAPQSLIDLIPPKTRIIQLVQFRKEGQEDHDVQVIINNDKLLSINILTLEGVELLALKIDNGNIDKKFLKIEIYDFFKNFVLPDIFFTYVTKEGLSQSPLKNLTLIDSKNERFISEGIFPIMKITFTDKERPLAADITIDNYKFNYHVDVKKLSLESL